MKTIMIMAIVAVAVLALGSAAWAAGRAYTYDGYGDCGWRNATSVASHAPATQPDATGGTVHQHRCGHWWGWLVPGHRANCCTWDQGYRCGGPGRHRGGCY